MPEFSYVAIGPDGRRVSGRAAAASEEALADALRTRGQYLVEAGPAGAAGAGARLASIRVLDRVTRRDVIVFTGQLAAVVAAGVNLVDGLRDIEAQAVKAPLKAVIAGVRRGVERGQSLSAAMALHPAAFNELYVSIVRAGEASGRVDRALDDLVQQLEWQEALAGKVREASTYPLIVVGLLAVLLTVLVGFTIPRFARVYQNVNANLALPAPTRAVQAVAAAAASNALVIAFALVAAYVLYRLRVQAPGGRAWRDRWLLRLPLAGDVARKVALSRFAHAFGSLHQSGVEVAPSLSLVERVIGNAYIAGRFRAAVSRVLAGEPLSRALAAVGEFSPLVIQMVALGEKTGEMEKSLRQVRQYYDREVDRSVNRAITLFGPAALGALALVFVLIAVAFYLPMFNLARALTR
ncbi:MAG TPA: type II secretion system F family protein [Vicinamibacterales bacterium]|nr:type II secretion system F family protein [Vicinamibacterales bacterium]HOQ61644.1 type II secretion system F family protein [Vicinamibacterales bacterium]HPK71066.1 type II secretion system F family protein [Vicinamibacterales bacterium]